MQYFAQKRRDSTGWLVEANFKNNNNNHNNNNQGWRNRKLKTSMIFI